MYDYIYSHRTLTLWYIRKFASWSTTKPWILNWFCQTFKPSSELSFLSLGEHASVTLLLIGKCCANRTDGTEESRQVFDCTCTTDIWLQPNTRKTWHWLVCIQNPALLWLFCDTVLLGYNCLSVQSIPCYVLLMSYITAIEPISQKNSIFFKEGRIFIDLSAAVITSISITSKLERIADV